jgi:hypothetical protein
LDGAFSDVGPVGTLGDGAEEEDNTEIPYVQVFSIAFAAASSASAIARRAS